MHDFVFHNPTRIVFGRGKERLVGTELEAAGINKVLLVYGQGSCKRSGLYGRVTASLGEHGIAYADFGGVVANPVLSHTRAGIELACRERVEAVLAVGGGSVLDEGKAIAVGAKCEDDVWNYFTGKEVAAALPVFTILTLAATGSEMNGNSVVTNEETRQKYNISSPLVYPRVSILNPELTCTVPPDHTAYGAVDAIAHVIEGYFTREPGARLQDRLVESLIRTVIDTTGVLLREPADYEARAEFMWTATLALNGLTTAGIGSYGFPNHMLEHPLSALYNIAHGAGLAIVIPAWMAWYRRQRPEKFARFAGEIFGIEGGAAGIEAFKKWLAAIKAPVSLGEAGIPAADLDMIAANAADLAVLWDLGGTYTRPVIREILARAL